MIRDLVLTDAELALSSNRCLNENVSHSGMRWWIALTRHTSIDRARTDGACAVRARSLNVCLDNDGPFIDVGTTAVNSWN
jgi:hypothetical protein